MGAGVGVRLGLLRVRIGAAFERRPEVARQNGFNVPARPRVARAEGRASHSSPVLQRLRVVAIDTALFWRGMGSALIGWGSIMGGVMQMGKSGPS